MKQNYSILPSIIAHSQEELDQRIEKVHSFFPLLHLDIMDGQFVKNRSLFFDFLLPKNVSCEAHLMVENPEEWVFQNLKKVDAVLVPIESCTVPYRLIQFVHDADKRIGFALNPETPLSEIEEFLEAIDLVLVMTVHPGQYGAAFVPETLEKIKELSRRQPALPIEVDGSINPDTIKHVADAGASRFVVGSYLQKAENVSAAVQNLKKA